MCAMCAMVKKLGISSHPMGHPKSKHSKVVSKHISKLAKLGSKPPPGPHLGSKPPPGPHRAPTGPPPGPHRAPTGSPPGPHRVPTGSPPGQRVDDFPRFGPVSHVSFAPVAPSSRRLQGRGTRDARRGEHAQGPQGWRPGPQGQRRAG